MLPQEPKTCWWCGIELHYNKNFDRWRENNKPDCPKNPAGSKYGHMIKLEEGNYASRP